MNPARIHCPVMVREVGNGLDNDMKVIQYLGKNTTNIGCSPLFVDGCAGLGGHSRAILDAFPTSHLICIDRDPVVCSFVL